jgi:thiamine-monophosphate kinase
VSDGEDALIRWVRRRLKKKEEKDHLRDDTATLPASGSLVVTVDQQVEGIHFLPGLDPRIVGRRLLAVNLSDLAASGATPRWALLALQVPPRFDPKPLFSGLLEGCRRHGVSLVGGDVSRAGALAASLTLLGLRRRGAASLARDRARRGHALFLGGTLGESALGRILVEYGARWRHGRVELARSLGPLPPSMVLAARRAVKRHLLPEPQLALGQKLAASRGAGAAIDVSDGFAKDLHRLCVESGAGARVDAAALAAASPRGFDSLCEHLGLDPLSLRLAGGEDYVLLFTAPASSSVGRIAGVRRVGSIVPGSGVELVEDGRSHALSALGWDHLERVGRFSAAGPRRRGGRAGRPARRRGS